MSRALTLAIALPWVWSWSEAAESSLANDPLTKSSDPGRGKNRTDTRLFEQSIQTTKQSIARETLDVFYNDALDYYYKARYDEALDVLNKIYSIDPYYKDVAVLRESVTNLKSNREFQNKRGEIDDLMRKGDAAKKSGKKVQAITYWKQLLSISPGYRPALKKIETTNREMAQQQYEDGYRNYKRQDYEQALDNWSNAVALDPSLKKRGLLVMMTKTQLVLQKGQSQRLTTQAATLYKEKNLLESLQIYQQILSLEPRHEEARRMSQKIKIELGSAAYASARSAMSRGQYRDAISNWQDAIRYGQEVEASRKGIREAEARLRPAPKAAKSSKPAATPSTEGAAESQTAPAPVARKPTNPVEANKHYRLGLAAIRSKDYYHALEELELAAQYDPYNEHIYVARERARQEWKANQPSGGAAQ
jgi:tetratricopeptide (TPR) repeat protein